MKKFFVILLSLILSVAMIGCGSSQNTGTQPAQQKPEADKAAKAPEAAKPEKKEAPSKVPVSIAVSTWIGFAPLYVAKEKGFFDQHGVDMTIINMGNVADRRSALAANKIQGFATTVDTHVVTAASGIDVAQILALDDSYGGDGIVAKKEIKDFKDLKGKSVAVQTDGGASFFWFLYGLQKAGINASDIKFQSMGAGDAGAAFVAGKVDAAVTWEPWLTKATQTKFGHVLMLSDATPGVISDTIGMSKAFIKEHPEAIQGIVDAWFDAIEYWKKNPDDANAIMAKAMGQTKDEFKESLKGVRLYDKEINKKYFGTKENKGDLYKLTEMASTFWLDRKIIDKKPDIDALIDSTFINK